MYSDSVLSQSSIVKTIPNNIENSFGMDVIRYSVDSFLLLAGISDNQLNNTGTEILKVDSNLNIITRYQYLCPTLGSYFIKEVNSQDFILGGELVDSLPIAPSLSIPVSCLALIKINNNGDTLWVRSYCPVQPTIIGYSLRYLGQNHDTLIFFGAINRSNTYNNRCGLLVYIDADDGSLLNTFSYCDSTYGYSFQRGILDTLNRKLLFTGDRLALDLSGGSQVFLAELNYEGNVLSTLLISDSSSTSAVGGLIYHPATNALLISYDTDKYQTAVACTDYEMVLLDSNRQVDRCKYRPNFIPTRLELKDAEFLVNSTTYRLWSYNYFVDIDDSLNLITVTSLHYNFPAYTAWVTRATTFSEHIMAIGYQKQTNFSRKNLLLEKFTPEGMGCYYFSSPLTWNLQNGNVNISPTALTKSSYTNIGSTGFNLIMNNLTINDSLLCLWTGANETMQTSKKVIIYPNPADDHIVIKGTSKGKSKIQIIGVAGDLLFEAYHLSTEPEEEINIPLDSKITSGLYFMRIIQNNGQLINLKFIKL